MEAFMTSLPLRYVIMFTKHSSGMCMTRRHCCPRYPPMGTRNRKAIGRRVPSDSFALAMAMDLASSSAISREIALTSFLAAASCLVPPFVMSESSVAATISDVVLEFERSREGRGGGRLSTAMCAAETSLPRAAGAFRFDMVCCIMLDR